MRNIVPICVWYRGGCVANRRKLGVGRGVRIGCNISTLLALSKSMVEGIMPALLALSKPVNLQEEGSRTSKILKSSFLAAES